MTGAAIHWSLPPEPTGTFDRLDTIRRFQIGGSDGR
jgi:hypothetical protein